MDAARPRDSGDAMSGEQLDARAHDGSSEGGPRDAGRSEPDAHGGVDAASNVDGSEPAADDDPDAGTDDCTAVAANLLIVFDESGSMNEPWQATTKLEVAKDGVRAAAATLPDAISVGALFFPTEACIPALPPPPLGSVAPIETSPQIGFRSATAFVDAWDAKWAAGPAVSSGIGTPLQEAFDRADVALTSSMSSTAPVHVVLLTDGEAANCFPDGDGSMTTVPPWTTDTPAHRVQAWVDAGITVHVIAFPGANPVELAPLATAAGTSTILPDDAPGVAAALEALLVGSTCP